MSVHIESWDSKRLKPEISVALALYPVLVLPRQLNWPCPQSLMIIKGTRARGRSDPPTFHPSFQLHICQGRSLEVKHTERGRRGRRQSQTNNSFTFGKSESGKRWWRCHVTKESCQEIQLRLLEWVFIEAWNKISFTGCK